MEFENNKGFQIKLFDPTGGAIIGIANQITINITEDDGKIQQILYFHPICKLLVLYFKTCDKY